MYVFFHVKFQPLKYSNIELAYCKKFKKTLNQSSEPLIRPSIFFSSFEKSPQRIEIMWGLGGDIVCFHFASTGSLAAMFSVL